MSAKDQAGDLPFREHHDAAIEPEKAPDPKPPRWKRILGVSKTPKASPTSRASSDQYDEIKVRPEKWSLGVLNDKETDEVPGSVLLMSNTTRNEPLGLRNAPARTSASSLPSPFPPSARRPSSTRSSTRTPSSTRPPMFRRESERSIEEDKKRTADNKIILDPQPDDSMNDPLNWPAWRRDIALLSLGFYCALGGGMTPVLAAGFDNVSQTYSVSVPKVALTTGFYMLGLGIGSVLASPTAILFGKRPVYLVGIILFIISAVWCAVSPNYSSLVVARIFMGLAVSPVECLPSATIAEIFFLHERAFRLGIYTLLLLGGKNLIPLVSAAIIQGLSWRWVFWIIAVVVGFCLVTVFLFVPETVWDRTPRPQKKTRKTYFRSLSQLLHPPLHHGEKSNMLSKAEGNPDTTMPAIHDAGSSAVNEPETIAERRQRKNQHHVGFAEESHSTDPVDALGNRIGPQDPADPEKANPGALLDPSTVPLPHSPGSRPSSASLASQAPPTPSLRSSHSPYYASKESEGEEQPKHDVAPRTPPDTARTEPVTADLSTATPGIARYTTYLRTQPTKTFRQTLKPWNGHIRHENWLKVAIRPFILFAYPGILWSTLVYSLSIGWLIVLSESVTSIYRDKATYNFSALGTGLVYLSPFIGGVLGTAVAGKVSDILVRFMSRRNGGVYEPEFRLVMAIPVTLATVIGLMGFGWSAAEKDRWIVPTIFFGIISFGCSLGSTTSITFAVDSYRQYAGEALVTLNFSKNIFHGFVFSLFFNKWLEADGSKDVFVAIGGIQIACLLTTIPMYIYGKRLRMWTVRKNMMEKF
ncbi:MAG: hypothetical protein Q9191_005328 [Dirinaria sp. TL-2023a]